MVLLLKCLYLWMKRFFCSCVVSFSGSVISPFLALRSGTMRRECILRDGDLMWGAVPERVLERRSNKPGTEAAEGHYPKAKLRKLRGELLAPNAPGRLREGWLRKLCEEGPGERKERWVS